MLKGTSNAPTTSKGATHYTRIVPTHGWVGIRLNELWDYRELLFFLAHSWGGDTLNITACFQVENPWRWRRLIHFRNLLYTTTKMSFAERTRSLAVGAWRGLRLLARCVARRK